MKYPSTLAICHLAFLAGIAFYLGSFYPTCQTVALLLVLAGAGVECCPRTFRKPLVPEILLGAAVAAAWWLWPASATAADACRAAGMVVAYLLLVTRGVSRDGGLVSAGSAGSPRALGRLKWLLGLVVLELVYGTGSHGTELAAMSAIVIGLSALAVDSWLTSSIPTTVHNGAPPNMGVSVLRWALLPALFVVTATGLISAKLVEATAGYHATQQLPRASQVEEGYELLDLQENMSIGDHRSIERDPRIVARLAFESGSAPTGMVYLRALALPDLVLTGSAVGWVVRSQRSVTPPSASPPARWAHVQRVASGSDVVLRPDGASTGELPETASDDAGNLYSAALRNRAYTYRTGFDDQPLKPRKTDPAVPERYLEIDPRLNALPWDQFEDPQWRLMSPERAAALICSRLQSVCSYELDNLPLPMDGPGGALHGFLFGATREARRGHCQYFATAAALLLRRAGHPTRCVGGFGSDETDPSGVTFRALHLHAWIEVINSLGEWQRFDPSPESRMAQTLAGVPLPQAKADRSEGSAKKNLASSAPQVRRWLGRATPTFWAVLLSGVALFGAFRCRKWLSGASRPRDPRLRELQRRNDDLIKVATTLGIMVTPATTLSDLIAALEARTNLSMGAYLRAHLAARFGDGPLPAPWPFAELVNAGKAKASETRSPT